MKLPSPANDSGERSRARRALGAKSIGGEPLGAKSIGGEPLGAKPIGGEPLGAKSIGGKPLGAAVHIAGFGWRPYGRRHPIFSDFSLQIGPGERVLLAGPSGSGKSTLLRAIAGVLHSTESGEFTGTVSIDGHAGGSVGLLLQDPTDAAVAGLVGRDVAFGPENFGVERPALWAAVHETLRAVRFPFGLEHPVSATSGGQAQRLALAGVLVLGSRLILLDEPTSMLDPVSAASVREAVWAAGAASGATMLLVEHRFDEWLPQLDRLMVLDATGRVTADGPIGDTLRSQRQLLAGHGIWIPGDPAPTPVLLPNGMLRPLSDGAAAGGPGRGNIVLRATGVGVIRPPRSGMLAIGGHTPDSHTPDLPVPELHTTAGSAALVDIDVEVRAGEILAVVGESGAGKSTLTALLAGLTMPTTGTIALSEALAGAGTTVLGRLSSQQLAARVGWVPQRAELSIVARTVRDDVLSTVRRLDQGPAAQSRADALLGALGLTSHQNADPHTLSGGELRRLALAGAIAHGPAMLILDEPTVGQDSGTWAAVVGVILSARDAGVAVVVATHDPLLIGLADRQLWLAGGRVVGSASSTRNVDRALGLAPAVSAVSAVSAAPAARESPVAPVARPNPSRRPSLAARCGPLSLLTVSLLLLVGSFGITSRVAGISVLVELVLLTVVLGWRAIAVKRVLPSLLAVTSVGFSTWLLGPTHDPMVGAVAALRITFFVVPGVLLAWFIDPSALGDHLAQRLRLPARPVIAAVVALQRFDTLGEQWQQLRGIRRVRGLGGGRAPAARAREFAALTFSLLVQTIRQAARMAVAMDSRGFSVVRSDGRPRTWAAGAPWTRADTVLVMVGALVAALPGTLAVILP